MGKTFDIMAKTREGKEVAIARVEASSAEDALRKTKTFQSVVDCGPYRAIEATEEKN